MTKLLQDNQDYFEALLRTVASHIPQSDLSYPIEIKVVSEKSSAVPLSNKSTFSQSVSPSVSMVD